MEVSNPPTLDSTKSLVLPVKLIGHIKAAIYTSEGRQVLDALTFVVVFVYCVSLNDEAPYLSKG